MSGRDLIHSTAEVASTKGSDADLPRPLIEAPPSKAMLLSPSGVVIGELIGLSDNGTTPLVLYPGQPGTAAVAARSIVDLHAAHIGKSIVLMFDQGDADQPIVMGVLRGAQAWPTEERPAQVEVDADGQRMIVSAREQLVLRCGKASITLTKAGKVLVEGTYLLSRSSGLNQIDGASVHLN
jgi:hypothetical protein